MAWNIEFIYNVFYFNDLPILYKEIPYIESGDFKNIYTYYFDDSLRVIAVKFHSIFFDSVCVDGALNLEILRFYNKTFEVKNEKVVYYDFQKKVPLDTAKCINNYDLDLTPKYISFNETPLHSIKQLEH